MVRRVLRGAAAARVAVMKAAYRLSPVGTTVKVVG